MRYRVFQQSLDGTNDVNVNLPGPGILSVTVVPDTTTVAVSVRPSDQGDFLPLRSGRTFTFELNGIELQVPVLSLRASSAVTVLLVVGYAQ